MEQIKSYTGLISELFDAGCVAIKKAKTLKNQRKFRLEKGEIEKFNLCIQLLKKCAGTSASNFVNKLENLYNINY